MIKLVNLLHKNPDVSWEFFVDYYNNNHAPLVLRTVPEIGKYVRNFIRRDSGVDMAHAEHENRVADFDVITEFWFADQQAFDAMMERVKDKAVADLLAKDEAIFLDRTRAQVFFVEENVSA
ncbi:hypothetical protein J2W40_003673 [Sphingobium xenophagum]|uniref:EthD domain-containing protein n=1 Tax=Sphingobium xenophagum TaxID=121428 RepID=A0ABU1X6Z3_SPHXE|nr:EthD domain-containing protein [Sphingobium xenophagum]MDR7156827.1 hypothetical protein [Sphingobium xenophagum]